MICKKCKYKFEQRPGYVNYCSDKCKNSRVFSAETKRKKSVATVEARKRGTHAHLDYNEINSRSTKKILSIEAWKQKLEARIEAKDVIWTGTLKKYLIQMYGHICMNCKIDSWNGNYLPMEIDHIDGDNKNNSLSNLRILCPNCHAQTDTWRSKNIKLRKSKQ